MGALRLGDDVDDYCIKCKRITNHSVLALVEGEPVKVRCRTCYNEGPYRRCVVPPTKRELQKAALLEQMLRENSPPAAEPPKKAARRKKA
ncbi:MAG: hypothetical protein KatS3mg004_1303 [Bryobacteraceae bacterium]|nr:MAG: hypothetical protein KatS3mg004_1303 [Bryobacteraceae bacterium]